MTPVCFLLVTLHNLAPLPHPLCIPPTAAATAAVLQHGVAGVIFHFSRDAIKESLPTR